MSHHVKVEEWSDTASTVDGIVTPATHSDTMSMTDGDGIATPLGTESSYGVSALSLRSRLLATSLRTTKPSVIEPRYWTPLNLEITMMPHPIHDRAYKVIVDGEYNDFDWVSKLSNRHKRTQLEKYATCHTGTMHSEQATSFAKEACEIFAANIGRATSPDYETIANKIQEAIIQLATSGRYPDSVHTNLRISNIKNCIDLRNFANQDLTNDIAKAWKSCIVDGESLSIYTHVMSRGV